MDKIKRIGIEIIKLVIIFISTIMILSYGTSMLHDEYYERIRENEPQRAAEQVGIFNFLSNR